MGVSVMVRKEQIILKSVGSYLYDGEVGAIGQNNLPILTSESCPIDEHLSIEWIQALDFRDFETFSWYVKCLELELSDEQKNCVEWKMTKTINTNKPELSI